MSDTVPVSKSNEVRGLAEIPQACDLVEEAYLDLGRNDAQVTNRLRLHILYTGLYKPTRFFLSVTAPVLKHLVWQEKEQSALAVLSGASCLDRTLKNACGE